MKIFKGIVIFTISIIIGFGAWYLMGWLISNQSNIFLWHPIGKIIYLIMGFLASSNVAEQLSK